MVDRDRRACEAVSISRDDGIDAMGDSSRDQDIVFKIRAVSFNGIAKDVGGDCDDLE